MHRILDFEEKHRWQRLEDLIEKSKTRLRSTLSTEELRELGELYRRTSSDLAIARVESRDPELISYLNNLLIRAHSRIYQADSRAFSIIKKFYLEDFPRDFCSNINYMKLAGAVFVSFIILGFFLAYRDVEFTEFVYLRGIKQAILSNDYWWKDLNSANQIGASFIMTNNILVSIRAFAMGAFFGIGSLVDLALFGAHVGAVFGAAMNLNPPFATQLGEFVIGHGVVELTTVVFCGGAGLMLGYSLIDPGELSRLEALKKKGVEAARIVFGSATFLVFAGIIEGFISPSDLPPVIKYSIGITSGIALFSYLLYFGKKRK
jgi:uncharacterized membrane protein SpoIIM required for sporulation